MLGKLLKHEFRATGRIMLPVLGVVAILAVLGNFSLRTIDQVEHLFPTILLGLLIGAFFLGMFAAWVVAIVLMIRRFRTNLLGDEGYLMFTLPTNVHELVWSKLIVSFVWFVLTLLVIGLVMCGTVLHLSELNIGQVLAGFPSWAEIRQALAEAGIPLGKLVLLGGEYLAGMILASLSACLQVYASLAIGHSFSKDKILLSILAFVAISILTSILGSGVGVVMFQDLELLNENGPAVIELLLRMSGRTLLLTLLQAAALYAITTGMLKKRLNLG